MAKIEAQAEATAEGTVSEAPVVDDEGNEQVSKQEALRRSYTEATRVVVQENEGRFNEVRQATMKEYGYEWTPKPTAEEKAALEIEKLLAQHPGLSKQISHLI